MADYMAAEITVGGKVPKRLVPGLCRRICEQGVSADEDEGPFEPHSVDELMAVCRDIGGNRVLWMWDAQACCGEFSVLEAYLQGNHISYRRQSDSRYEYDAEVVEFRPEIGLVRMLANKSGEPLVSLKSAVQAVALLNAVKSLLDKARVPEARREIRRGLTDLWAELPPPIPPLEPFQLI